MTPSSGWFFVLGGRPVRWKHKCFKNRRRAEALSSFLGLKIAVQGNFELPFDTAYFQCQIALGILKFLSNCTSLICIYCTTYQSIFALYKICERFWENCAFKRLSHTDLSSVIISMSLSWYERGFKPFWPFSPSVCRFFDLVAIQFCVSSYLCVPIIWLDIRQSFHPDFWFYLVLKSGLLYIPMFHCNCYAHMTREYEKYFQKMFLTTQQDFHAGAL